MVSLPLGLIVALRVAEVSVRSDAARVVTEGGAAGGPPSFDFGSGDGSTADGSTQLSQARLTTGPGSATFADTALATVQGVDNVSSATATLSLTNINFSGEIPDFQAGGGGLLKLLYWQAVTLLNPHFAVGTKFRNAASLLGTGNFNFGHGLPSSSHSDPSDG